MLFFFGVNQGNFNKRLRALQSKQFIITSLTKWWMRTSRHRSRCLVLWINPIHDIPRCLCHKYHSIISFGLPLILLIMIFHVLQCLSSYCMTKQHLTLSYSCVLTCCALESDGILTGNRATLPPSQICPCLPLPHIQVWHLSLNQQSVAHV